MDDVRSENYEELSNKNSLSLFSSKKITGLDVYTTEINITSSRSKNNMARESYEKNCSYI